MKQPSINIAINGMPLTKGQVMTMHTALCLFNSDLEESGCGNDEYGLKMTKLYQANISQIQELMSITVDDDVRAS